MTIKQLTYFLTLAKHQSFTKASGELYLSQSALSKAIKNLEFELGVTLIDRTSNKFKLSSEGVILYENGNLTLESINKKFEELIDSISSEKGSLKIGVPPVISTVYFTTITHKFSKLYPEINLTILEEGAENVRSEVEKGNIDIGVIILPFEDNEFDIFPVFKGENVAVVNKKHPLAKEESIDLEKLKDEKFIILNSTYMLYNRIIENCDKAGFVPNVISTSSQWDYITEMVALNHCVSILPKQIVLKYQSKNIKLLSLKNPIFPWDMALIIRKDKYKSKPLKAFIEFCRNEGETTFKLS